MGEFDRGTASAATVALYQDGNYGSAARIFQVQVAPGGTYGIRVYVGDANFARDNIQVNAVLPGWIDTELTQGARRHVPELHDRVLTRTPAGRWGVPEDLAGIAVFLAAPASDFVTGAAIPVDGGYSSMGV